MPNAIKTAGEGVALQATSALRRAGLVTEDTDGEANRLAPLWAHVVPGLVILTDRDRVDDADRAAMVASAARDAGGVFGARRCSVQVSGGGYRVQLPGAQDAGLEEGDEPGLVTGQGTLIVYDRAAAGAQRRARDIVDVVGST